MREIVRASIAFLCTDIVSKRPITDVVVFFDGEIKEVIRKNDGYCVFTGLYPRKYSVVIRAAGYEEQQMELNIRENETKTVFVTMMYTKNNIRLYNMRRFEFHVTSGNKPLSNSKIIVKLNDDSDFFKLVKPIEKESVDVFLNAEVDNSHLVQHYFYEENSNEYDLFFTGYDYIQKCYTLEEATKKKIAADGKLYPYWELVTDSKGVAVLPFMPRFMKKNVMDFELRVKDKKSKVSADVSSVPDDKLYVLNVDFDSDEKNEIKNKS